MPPSLRLMRTVTNRLSLSPGQITTTTITITPLSSHHHHSPPWTAHPSSPSSSSPFPTIHYLSFSTTRTSLKKGNNSSPKNKKSTPPPASSSSAHAPDNKAQANRDRDVDPYDFSELESKITHQIDWLRESLQKLRGGGRLSAEMVEGLLVEVKSEDGGSGGGGRERRGRGSG